jgi:transposase
MLHCSEIKFSGAAFSVAKQQPTCRPHLDDVVPEDHLVRKVDTLDPSWLRNELAPPCSTVGRPSIDPEPTIRMLVVGCLCDPLGEIDLS